MCAESPRDQRVLVIGLSTVKNEEVVASLRDLGIDAIGCTEPDTAAERYDARQFKVIAFGRAALGGPGLTASTKPSLIKTQASASSTPSARSR